MKTLLVFPPFWVQSLVWILHLNPRPPFCVLFSWLFFFVPGLFAWVDGCVFFYFYFFFIVSCWRCIVHGGKWPTRLWMQPSFYIFLCMNVHLWCLCNTLCVMWPSFQNGICSDLWLTIFPCRDGRGVWNWNCGLLFHLICRLRRSTDTFLHK